MSTFVSPTANLAKYYTKNFFAAQHLVFEEGGGGGSTSDLCHRMEVPRPALRGEGEVKNPARRSPGGRRKESTIHFEPLFSLNIFGFSHLAVTSVSRSCDKKSYTVN